MTKFKLTEVKGGWQIDGDGDIYEKDSDARIAIVNHCEAEGITDYVIITIWSFE